MAVKFDDLQRHHVVQANIPPCVWQTLYDWYEVYRDDILVP